MPSLDRFVAGMTIASPAADRIDRLPDGSASIIFRRSCDGVGDLHVLGPLTRAQYKRNARTRTAVKVLFRPGGGYPFFGVALTELVDRVVPLRDLWGTDADDLLDKLAKATTDAERTSLVEHALAGRLRHAAAGRGTHGLATVQEAARRLAGRQTSIRQLARELDLSERNFRRVFASVVGLSPKRYARMMRFRRAMSYAAEGVLRWPEIAVESGYFDQSHMTADFQEFSRASPESSRHGDIAESLRRQCA